MTDDLIKISKLPTIYKRTMALMKELRGELTGKKEEKFSIRVHQLRILVVDEILPHIP